jgi:hypothetical protein
MRSSSAFHQPPLASLRYLVIWSASHWPRDMSKGQQALRNPIEGLFALARLGPMLTGRRL